MNAEIGIGDDGEPYITLTPLSTTEFSLVQRFAKKLGIVVPPGLLFGDVYIEPRREAKP